MFSRVNLNEENVSTYVRFSEIKVSNPISGEPLVSITVDAVADITGNIVVVKS